jgi:hypothetical protein
MEALEGLMMIHSCYFVLEENLDDSLSRNIARLACDFGDQKLYRTTNRLRLWPFVQLMYHNNEIRRSIHVKMLAFLCNYSEIAFMLIVDM